MKPDSRREIQWADWNSTHPLANMEASCCSERIRGASKWEIRGKTDSCFASLEGDHANQRSVSGMRRQIPCR